MPVVWCMCIKERKNEDKGCMVYVCKTEKE